MRIKTIVSNILIFSFSLLAGFGIAEGYFRIFNPQPIRPAVFQVDPVYGLKMAPGLKGYNKEKEYIQRFSLNSLGFRDKEHTAKKADNVFRIICLGDSFTWGAGVEEDKTYPRELERNLNGNAINIKYEVFNWGVSAWGTSQQFLCLKEQALSYNPDLVILQYYKGNDFLDNMYSNLFNLDGQGHLKRASEFGWENTRAIKSVSDRMPYYRFLTQHSHFINFIRAHLIGKVTSIDINRLNNGLITDDFGYGLRLTEALLTDFFIFAKDNEVKVVFIIIPDKYELGLLPNPLKPIEKKRLAEEQKMLISACRKYGIPLLDMLNRFSQEDPSLVYYREDTHLMPYGHKIIGKELSEIIRANFLN